MATASSSPPRATAAATATATAEPLYGGYSRFELELEFVQSLANPAYLHYLARQKVLEKPEFIAYLAYLQYFKQPDYIKHLQHPAPTLRALELLQQERFRNDIADPNVLNFMTIQWLENAIPPATD